MIRLILALLFAILLTRWLLTLAHGARTYSKRNDETNQAQSSRPADNENNGALVPCAQCGTYIPRADAISAHNSTTAQDDTEEKYFCSIAHQGIFEQTTPKS